VKRKLSNQELTNIKTTFNKLHNDLITSDKFEFVKYLEQFFNYSKTYPISELIKNYDNITDEEFNQWYNSWNSSDSPGHKKYKTIPRNEHGKAFIYNLLGRIVYDKIDLREFCDHTKILNVSGLKSRYIEFDKVFIQRFVDDVNGFLDRKKGGKNIIYIKRGEWSKRSEQIVIGIIIFVVGSVILYFVSKILKIELF